MKKLILSVILVFCIGVAGIAFAEACPCGCKVVECTCTVKPTEIRI